MPKKSKFTLISPNDNEIEFFKKEYLNLGEVNNEIEKLEKEKPDARTSDYKIWVKKINFLMKIYNSKASFKSFKLYE